MGASWDQNLDIGSCFLQDAWREAPKVRHPFSSRHFEHASAVCSNGNGLLQEGLSGRQRSREGIPFTYLTKCRSVHLCEGASYKFLKPYEYRVLKGFHSSRDYISLYWLP